jgi:hypothetical protein
MAKLLRKLKQKASVWENIGGREGFHAALDGLDDALKITLLAKKVPCNYRDPTSIWGILAETSKMKEGNSLNNRKWLYTVWSNDRHEIRTSYESRQEIDNLLQLNAMKTSNDSNDVACNSNKVY